MTVVKSQNTSPMIHDAVVLDLGDLAGQARQILERARAEAESFIADARNEAARQAKRIIDEAREQGHREGVEQGLHEGCEQARAEVIEEFRPRLEELEQGWSQALSEWGQSRGELLMSAREDVLRLAVALAEKVVLRRIEQDPAIVQSQVEATVVLLGERAAPTIMVHPLDLELVREIVPALEAALGGSAHLTFRADESIGRGGCRVVTQRGEIDATIDTQLERIAAALLPDGNVRAPVAVHEDHAG